MADVKHDRRMHVSRAGMTTILGRRPCFCPYAVVLVQIVEFCGDGLAMQTAGALRCYVEHALLLSHKNAIRKGRQVSINLHRCESMCIVYNALPY